MCSVHGLADITAGYLSVFTRIQTQQQYRGQPSSPIATLAYHRVGRIQAGLLFRGLLTLPSTT